MECAARSDAAACVMSAANEAAVALFLNHRVGYNDIYTLARGAVDACGSLPADSLDRILAADAAARDYVFAKVR